MNALRMVSAALAGLLVTSSPSHAGPKVVSGPGVDPACFAPWNAETKYFQWDARPGPYRIAVVNGYLGNTWHIQMIKTAKAFAQDPAVKDKIAEFKVVSTGSDAPAQLDVIEDFINRGFDAIVTIAVSPEGFERVISLADREDVVIVPFDSVLDTEAVMQVHEDQLEMGRQWARFVLKELEAKGKTSGKILEVRGLAGDPVDRDRSDGIHEVFDATPGPWEIVQVVGNWDDGTAQMVTAGALAAQGPFDAVITQGGSTGTVQALLDARHPFVPVAGEAENGFRKLVARYSDEGLVGLSTGQSPGLVAISMKAAIAALEGHVMPQLISAPLPSVEHTALKDGANFWTDQPDNFFAANEFPPCGVNISGPAIMAQTEENVQ
jgi:ribose transport system substrate-binding protein